MFKSESRKRMEAQGIKVTMWDDFKVHFELFRLRLYDLLFPTKRIMMYMFYAMCERCVLPTTAYKYMKDSQIVKIRRGFKKITVWAKRPGIFIGEAGKDLYYLQEKLGKKIVVKEYKKMTAIDAAYDLMEFYNMYSDEY